MRVSFETTAYGRSTDAEHGPTVTAYLETDFPEHCVRDARGKAVSDCAVAAVVVRKQQVMRNEHEHNDKRKKQTTPRLGDDAWKTKYDGFVFHCNAQDLVDGTRGPSKATLAALEGALAAYRHLVKLGIEPAVAIQGVSDVYPLNRTHLEPNEQDNYDKSVKKDTLHRAQVEKVKSTLRH